MSWCGPLWVLLVWDSLSFLDMYVYFLHEIEDFFFIIFQINFQILLFLISFWHPCDLDVGTFKLVPKFPKPQKNFFLNFYFLILFQLHVSFFLLFQILDLSPDFLPFTVVSCVFFSISLSIAFTSSFFYSYTLSFL